MVTDRTETPTATLVRMLEEIAASLSMRCERNPDALTNPVSRAAEVSQAINAERKSSAVDATEDRTAGMFVDFHAVLISDLPTDSHSTGVSIEDLQLKLVGQ
jgi:hypothetical protein